MTTLNPPFKAKDMKALFKKVVKGQYPDIPIHYTNDLSSMIAMCLRVNATARPTAESLLKSKEVYQKLRLYNTEIENDENMNPNTIQDQLLQTIRVPNEIKNIQLPKSKYLGSRSNKRSHSYDRKKLIAEPLAPTKDRNATVFSVESSRKIKSSKLTLLKKKIGQSSSMHSRMKENRPKLGDDMKSTNEENRNRLDSLPRNRVSMNDQAISRIVLPKIRDKGIHRIDHTGNLNNLSSINPHQLPKLGHTKNSYEMIPKEKYLKYKSLLKHKNLETDREYQQRESYMRMQSSSSSQNMSVQEMMLDKVYGTIERDNKNYL